MQIHIIAVGKIKESFFRNGIAEYEKRLRPYAKVEVVEIPEERRPLPASAATESCAMEKEAERILTALPRDAFVFALDRTGEDWSSEELAASFSSRQISGQNRIAFVIGGDLGLAPAVLARSGMRLSLSRMTFTHPMARLVLLEQIYRAFRIVHGEPYHR